MKKTIKEVQKEIASLEIKVIEDRALAEQLGITEDPTWERTQAYTLGWLNCLKSLV